MTIIKTPQPDAEERLVLVPPESVGIIRENGTIIGLSIRTEHARDATPDDLGRAGYVLEEEEAITGNVLDFVVHTFDPGISSPQAAWARVLHEYGAVTALAEKAERERDEARAELARLTAPAEGEPSASALLKSIGRELLCITHAAVMDIFRLGVAHERARSEPAFLARLDEMIAHHKMQMDRVAVALGDEPHEGTHYEKHDMDCIVGHIKERLVQPAQDRATDEELFAIADAVYEEAYGGEILNRPHEIARRVAARVRQERCLVAQAVAANVDIRACEDDGGGFMVGVHAPGCDEALARCVPASDVPATLARLLGEVAK